MKHKRILMLLILTVSVFCFSSGCTNKSQTTYEAETVKDKVSDSKVLTLYEKIKSDAMAPSSSELDLSKAETVASQTVYRTQTGACYHDGRCPHLAKSKIKISLREAKTLRLRACSKCDPPIVK